MRDSLQNNCVIVALLCLFTLSANSQVLTTERNAYRAADQLVKQQVEFKDPGSSGKNLTWDFRFLQPINEEYALNYFIPDSTQMTRLCGQEHNTRYYFREQRDSLQAVGYENSTTYMEYPTPELRMRFPFAYGDTLFSYFEGKGQYCHRLALAVKGYTRIEADAKGELLLPKSETVKKALRVRTLRHYTETGKDSVEMTLDTYSWYAAGIRYPVFESVKTTLSKKLPSTSGESAGGKVDTTVFSTSFYYPPEKQISQVETAPIPEEVITAEQGAAAVFTEAEIMPNPVIDNLYLKYKLVRSAKVWFTVHNNIGIPQRSTSPQNLDEGNHNTTVPMGNLIPGVYSLFVHVDDMVMRLNVVKQ
jgi:hypothetical protein